MDMLRRRFAGNVLDVCTIILDYVDSANTQLLNTMEMTFNDVIN